MADKEKSVEEMEKELKEYEEKVRQMRESLLKKKQEQDQKYKQKEIVSIEQKQRGFTQANRQWQIQKERRETINERRKKFFVNDPNSWQEEQQIIPQPDYIEGESMLASDVRQPPVQQEQNLQEEAQRNIERINKQIEEAKVQQEGIRQLQRTNLKEMSQYALILSHLLELTNLNTIKEYRDLLQSKEVEEIAKDLEENDNQVQFLKGEYAKIPETNYHERLQLFFQLLLYRELRATLMVKIMSFIQGGLKKLNIQYNGKALEKKKDKLTSIAEYFKRFRENRQIAYLKEAKLYLSLVQKLNELQHEQAILQSKYQTRAIQKDLENVQKNLNTLYAQMRPEAEKVYKYVTSYVEYNEEQKVEEEIHNLVQAREKLQEDIQQFQEEVIQPEEKKEEIIQFIQQQMGAGELNHIYRLRLIQNFFQQIIKPPLKTPDEAFKRYELIETSKIKEIYNYQYYHNFDTLLPQEMKDKMKQFQIKFEEQYINQNFQTLYTFHWKHEIEGMNIFRITNEFAIKYIEPDKLIKDIVIHVAKQGPLMNTIDVFSDEYHNKMVEFILGTALLVNDFPVTYNYRVESAIHKDIKKYQEYLNQNVINQKEIEYLTFIRNITSDSCSEMYVTYNLLLKGYPYQRQPIQVITIDELFMSGKYRFCDLVYYSKSGNNPQYLIAVIIIFKIILDSIYLYFMNNFSYANKEIPIELMNYVKFFNYNPGEKPNELLKFKNYEINYIEMFCAYHFAKTYEEVLKQYILSPQASNTYLSNQKGLVQKVYVPWGLDTQFVQSDINFGEGKYLYDLEFPSDTLQFEQKKSQLIEALFEKIIFKLNNISKMDLQFKGLQTIQLHVSYQVFTKHFNDPNRHWSLNYLNTVMGKSVLKRCLPNQQISPEEQFQNIMGIRELYDYKDYFEGKETNKQQFHRRFNTFTMSPLQWFNSNRQSTQYHGKQAQQVTFGEWYNNIIEIKFNFQEQQFTLDFLTQEIQETIEKFLYEKNAEYKNFFIYESSMCINEVKLFYQIRNPKHYNQLTPNQITFFKNFQDPLVKQFKKQFKIKSYLEETRDCMEVLNERNPDHESTNNVFFSAINYYHINNIANIFSDQKYLTLIIGNHIEQLEDFNIINKIELKYKKVKYRSTEIKPIEIARYKDPHHTILIYMDIESYIDLEKVHIPKLICCYVVDLFYQDLFPDHYKVFQDCESFIEYLFSFLNTKNDVYVFAHNGGRYDFMFLEPYLLKFGSIQVFGKVTDAKCFNIYNIHFRDTFNIMCSSLSKLQKVYCPDAPEKQDMSQYFQPGCKWHEDPLIQPIILEYCKYDCKLLHDIHKSFVLSMINIFNKTQADEFHDKITKHQNLFNHFIKKCYSQSSIASFSLYIFQLFYLRQPLFTPIRFLILSQERESYHGGLVHVLKKENQDGVTLYHYDVNSMYPHCMRFDMPVEMNNHIRYKKEERKQNIDNVVNHYLYAVSKFYYRYNYKTPGNIFSIKRKGLNQKYDIETVFDDGPIWIWGIELLAYRNYIKEVKIEYVYQYVAQEIFSGYVHDFYQFKSQSENSPIERQIAKNFLNNLYGKFGQRDFDDQFLVSVSEADMITGILQNEETNMKLKTQPVNPQVCLLSKQEYKTLPNTQHIGANVRIAAYITASARAMLMKVILQNYDNCYYCDTDSIVIDKPLTDNVGPLLGQFKLENVYKKGYFYAPKLYKVVLDNDHIHYKAKGVSSKLHQTLFDQINVGGDIDKATITQTQWKRYFGKIKFIEQQKNIKYSKI